MRGRIVPLGMAALVLALAPAGGGSARPLHIPAPEHQAKDPVALIWGNNGARLAALDPTTLRVRMPRTPLLGFVDAWAFEHPDGGVMAVAGSAASRNGFRPPDALRFVDLQNLSVQPLAVRLPGYANALLWTRPDRLVALVWLASEETCLAVAIDPAARQIVKTTPLWGEPSGIGRADDALVVLETPHHEIGPARLTVIGDTGDMRSAQLDRISAGRSMKWDAQGNPDFAHRIPALAVDPAGDRAYVIQADGPSAEIDLRTLAVAYHDLTAPSSLLSRLSAWLTPSADAKETTGPLRHGVWLGDGLIAVTGGDDSRVVDPKGNVSYLTTAAGLTIVDTRAWTVRMLDPRADSIKVGGGLLLATAVSSNEPRGMGLAAYGSDRKLRFALFRGRTVWLGPVLAGRAYVWTGYDKIAGVDRIAVVDLASGRVIAKRRDLLPTPVLADGP